jgi:acetylornithine deacetylase/succinyl-diaminopimelate desuccinylase-like protein
MFTLQNKAGKLIGRGVFDMKFAAACFLAATRELKDELSELDFGIMLTSDEEIGGEHGVGYLTDLGYGGEVVLLPDGGDNWQLEASAKGAWLIKVHASGRTGHGSRPWEGDNAADRLLEFVNAAKRIVPLGKRADSTMTLSQLSAGQAMNQTPASASATLDIRLASNSEQKRIKNALRQLAADLRVDLEEVVNINPIQLDTTLNAVQCWQQSVATVRGKIEDRFTASYGASDARYFSDHDMPCLITRPTGGGAHGEDEWIDANELQQFYATVVNFIKLFKLQPAAVNSRALAKPAAIR